MTFRTSCAVFCSAPASGRDWLYAFPFKFGAADRSFQLKKLPARPLFRAFVAELPNLVAFAGQLASTRTADQLRETLAVAARNHVVRRGLRCSVHRRIGTYKTWPRMRDDGGTTLLSTI